MLTEEEKNRYKALIESGELYENLHKVTVEALQRTIMVCQCGADMHNMLAKLVQALPESAQTEKAKETAWPGWIRRGFKRFHRKEQP
jgi:hypothetical protein